MPNNFHITEEDIAIIEFADLSLQFFKDLLCERFRTQNASKLYS